MTANDHNDEYNDSNSIMIRLNQIQKKGKVCITHNSISVFYQFSDNPSPIAKETTKYERTISFDELLSLDSAIDLSNCSRKEKSSLYDDYQNCFKKSKEIQQKIQILNNFGKTFVYEDHFFFNLNDTDATNISTSLDNLISKYKSDFNNDKNKSNINYFSNDINNSNIDQSQPKYPPFLTPNNLLYFGSLLQRRNHSKIIEILRKMFFHAPDDIITTAYEEAIKDENINDPMKSSILMFSIIYLKLSPYFKFPSIENDYISHNIFNQKIKNKQLLSPYSKNKQLRNQKKRNNFF